MNDTDSQVRSYVGRCFIYLHPEHLGRVKSFIREFIASPALMDDAEHLVKYLVTLSADAPELALDVTERILNVMGRDLTNISKVTSLLECDLVRLPLTVYTHTSDSIKKSRAMGIFEELLLQGSRSAYQALEDWDRQ